MSRAKSQKQQALARNGPSKLKKDPGVPKLPSLKMKQSLTRRPSTAGGPSKQDDTAMAAEPTLASLALEAQEQDAQHAGGIDDDISAVRRRQYVRTLHRVVESSDVVLLVLDARDPPGSRSRLVEEEVRRRDKKLVFILNKIDLVPRPNAEAWLAYLRHEAPTLPFRASTQSQRTHLSSRTTPAVMHLLKSFRKGPAGSITVGVVGAPNVGKSSLINSLKRARVCATAAEPGCTTDVQTVALERGLKIVDSPGVVFDDTQSDNSALLRNVLRVDEIADPVAVVEVIVARSDAETLQKLYKLPPFATPLEFLTMLALTTGRLGRGGAPDTAGAARVILRDWNKSKIPFFTDVPRAHASDVAAGAQIVAQFAPAFDLGALYASNDAQAFMEVEQDGDGDAMEEDGGGFVPDADPDEMHDDSLGQAAPAPSASSRKRKRDDLDSDDERNELPFARMDDDSFMSEHPAPAAAAAGRPAKRQRLEKFKKPRTQAPPPSLALASAAAVREAEAVVPVGRKAQRQARKKAAKRGDGAMVVDDDASVTARHAPATAFSFSVPFQGLGEVMI
ncbi:P-loop containing nucleoside triphosphate hydrolase protein [Auriculariales sp. MPI-PUGE-AT-0066]|nr:P-loop containing nucleoside triphosphate hydrolase protein [Auriculariales sp. MPI-PUGE-AT-0066]